MWYMSLLRSCFRLSDRHESQSAVLPSHACDISLVCHLLCFLFEGWYFCPAFGWIRFQWTFTWRWRMVVADMGYGHSRSYSLWWWAALLPYSLHPSWISTRRLPEQCRWYLHTSEARRACFTSIQTGSWEDWPCAAEGDALHATLSNHSRVSHQPDQLRKRYALVGLLVVSSFVGTSQMDWGEDHAGFEWRPQIHFFNARFLARLFGTCWLVHRWCLTRSSLSLWSFSDQSLRWIFWIVVGLAISSGGSNLALLGFLGISRIHGNIVLFSCLFDFWTQNVQQKTWTQLSKRSHLERFKLRKKDPQRVYSNSLKQERNVKTSWKPGLLTLILSFAALAQQLLGAVDSGEGRLDLAADVPGFGAVAYWYEEQDHLRDRDWNQAAEEIRCKERYHERFRNMQRLDHSGCLVFVDVFVFETINHGNWLLALWKWMDFGLPKSRTWRWKSLKKPSEVSICVTRREVA